MPCTGPVQCSLRCSTAAKEDAEDLEPTGTGLAGESLGRSWGSTVTAATTISSNLRLAGLGEKEPIFSTLPQPITEHLLAQFSLQDLIYNK